MTFLILDIIFSLILIFNVILGIKKGAIKIFLSLLAVICAAFITYCFSTTITAYLYNNYVEPAITDKIYSSIQNGETSEDILPDFIVKNADNVGLELDKLSLSSSLSRANVEGFVKNTLSETASAVIKVIVSLTMFLVIWLILKLLLNLFNKIVKYSYVDGFNSALGGAVGGIKGVIIIVLICFILSALVKNIIPLPNFMSEESVNKSLFYRLYLYIF